MGMNHILEGREKMKNRLVVILMVLTIMASMLMIAVSITPSSASPDELHVPTTDYPTIQAAITAASPGDTIIVSAGTYAGAIVDKNVTISVTPGETAIIISGVPYKDGSILYTAFRLDATADGAKIRGFTINCNSSESFYFAVFSRNVHNVTIDSLTVNDAVQGITNWGGSNWQITNNVLNNTEAAGGGGIAIFLGALPPSYPVCSGNLIQNNIITATATAPDYTCPGIGVALDLRYGAYDKLTGSEDISNNQILNNNITAPGSLNGVGIEIGVLGLEGNATKIAATLGIIHNNTIQGNNIEGADLGVYFYTVTDMKIQQNEIKNCNEGIHIEDGISGNIINYNNIIGNAIGINNTAGELIDARFNWWGNGTGPYHPITNPSGIGDNVSDYVDYKPWLIKPYPPAVLIPKLRVDSVTIESPAYGKNFTTDVKLANVTDLYGFEFKLYWNTTLLDLVEANVTPPWTNYANGTNQINETIGRYYIGLSALAQSPSFNGSTTLVTLTFKITYVPVYPEDVSCLFDLNETILGDPDGKSIPHIVYDGEYKCYAARAKIQVLPQVSEAKAQNQVFNLNINVANVANLYTFEFTLQYNTTLLDAQEITIPSFPNRTYKVSKKMIDDIQGNVTLRIESISPPLQANEGLELASITFQVTHNTTWPRPSIESYFSFGFTELITDTGVTVPHDKIGGLYRYRPIPGDMNSDGKVTIIDLAIVARAYGTRPGDPYWNELADLNNDKIINILDLIPVARNYGRTN